MKANVFISGNVQGVGYRFHVKRAEHKHHIQGPKAQATAIVVSNRIR